MLGNMGTRSRSQKFRRRRQGAGIALLMSLVIIVLGITLFFRTDPFERTEASSVERVSVPMLTQAPEAVAGQKQNSQDESANKGEGVAKEGDKNEQAASEEPVAPAPTTNDLWMTVPSLGLYDVYVSNSDAESALDYGLGKRTDSGFPWQNDANTYIVGHRLGWPGTGSDHIFYNLPLMNYGDKIYLYDANGTTYTYEVTEFEEVLPTETWVTRPVAGRPMVSLQTCIENYGDYWTMGPDWYVRYIVRADRVAVTPG
jgi:sortase A